MRGTTAGGLVERASEEKASSPASARILLLLLQPLSRRTWSSSLRNFTFAVLPSCGGGGCSERRLLGRREIGRQALNESQVVAESSERAWRVADRAPRRPLAAAVTTTHPGRPFLPLLGAVGAPRRDRSSPRQSPSTAVGGLQRTFVVDRQWDLIFPPDPRGSGRLPLLLLLKGSHS